MYSDARSPKTFTQHQLFAIAALRKFFFERTFAE